jgi:hypothetical protein
VQAWAARKEVPGTMDTGVWSLGASIVALVMGILILVFPRLLNYLVAAYLILIGILGLVAYFS